jgi:hypothetical protein
MAMSALGVPSQQPEASQSQEAAKLLQALRSGANWFYWIAGLSLLNSVIQMFDSDRSFVVGLGITQVFDAVASAGAKDLGSQGGTILRGIAFALDLCVAGVFALFGWQAGKRRRWAFLVGMFLYFLDALIFLLVQDWLSLGFHAFALVGIWAGFSSLRKLEALEVQMGLRPIGA